ncbi:ABC transporter ATP-binding protein [Luedemannella helvata]|uniref:ABC transporter ATP-binding protein n=1 Tax=Luedemannella helvata TaxID=349315 RepID=A0ABN2L350_9ACTN
MVTAAVSAHDVFCLYPTPRGHVAALRGLTLDVAAGERVVVHGPNGSGKTTLLRVLTGERAPSAGAVRVCGVELAGADARARQRLRGRHLGLVDQHHGRTLRPELTVRDNVALQLRICGVRPSAARRRAGDLLDRLGLGALADRRPAGLSGGESQRVAVCAAVAHGPALILADEPTGELDRASAEAVYDLLATCAADTDAALIIVSHDADAARVADRVVRTRDGRLSEEWAPSGAESLVVDDRGWVRLPEPLRHRAGVATRVVASAAPDGIVLAPVAGPAGSPSSEPVADAGPQPASGDLAARVRGVDVRLADRVILSGQDLDVPAGRLSVVRGRSGSGKSTLLRVLAGLVRPSAGEVVVAGVDLAGLDRAGLAALRRASLAFVGQGAALVETLSVAENLSFARSVRGAPGPADDAEDWLADLGLTALRDRPVGVLSGGERQRVAVARALCTRPAIAVLDEPTSRQDEANAERVVSALRAAAALGTAVVVATHDPLLVHAAHQAVTLP